MDARLPRKLKRDPIVEATWELRFESAKPFISELLPGLIYRGLQDKYQDVVPMRASEGQERNFEVIGSAQYAPSVQLVGKNRSVQIGQHVISLTFWRPYAGWEIFAQEIRELIRVIRETRLVDRLERFGLLYTNLINVGPQPTLAWVNLEAKLGAYDVEARPVLFRTRLDGRELFHLLEIVSPAQVMLPDDSGTVDGVLVSVNSVRSLGGADAWEVLDRELETVHDLGKRLFFDLLRAEIIEKLEPEYEEQRP
jgi:uncharacterized protein (TIGR04255 family)